MSDLIKRSDAIKHVCGECQFHKYFCLKSLDFMGITVEEWYCDNWNSKRSGQITQYNDTCEDWAKEEREDEPQTCDNCKLKDTTKWCNNKVVCRAYKPKDESQTKIDL